MCGKALAKEKDAFVKELAATQVLVLVSLLSFSSLLAQDNAHAFLEQVSGSHDPKSLSLKVLA